MDTIKILRSEIVRLERLWDFYLQEKGKADNATDKAFASLCEKMTDENLEFLYSLLKELDSEWDGKRFDY